MKRIGASSLPWHWRMSTSLVRRAGLIGLGVLSTTIVLLLYQINWQTVGESICSRTLCRAESAYPYPYKPASSKGALEAKLTHEIGFYQERLRTTAGSALDLATLASIYLQTARLTGESSWYLLAEQTAQQSLASLPFDNSGAIAVLARVAEARHDFQGALKLASQLPDEREAASIQATAYLALGKLPEAAQSAQQLVDGSPGQGAYTTLALVQTAQGKDKEALESFVAAIQVEEWGEVSGSARSRTLLGRFYYEHGQLEQAESLYKDALRILPDYPPALLNLAQLRLRQGHYRSADRLYGRVAAAQQGRFTVYTPLVLRGQARIARLRGDSATARQLWQQAETLLAATMPAPDSADASFSLGHRRDLTRLLLERNAPGDVARAVSLMQAEVRLRRDAETLRTYATALAQANRWQDAQPIVREALATGVQDASLFYLAGEIEQAVGQPAVAAAYFDRATGVDPKFDDAARHALDLGSGLGS